MQLEVAEGVRSRALSPSRAGDFMQCPLLYRFRVVDQLPEPVSAAAARGTLVHAVLERLFELPAAERTVEAAVALVPGEWERLLQEEPEWAELVREESVGPSGALVLDAAALEREAASLVEGWFEVEDPTLLRRLVEKLENEVAAKEEEKSVLEAKLADPGFYGQGEAFQQTMRAFADVEAELRDLMKQWERAAAKLEAAEA